MPGRNLAKVLEKVYVCFLCWIEMYLCDPRFQRFNASKHWSLTTMPQLWLCKTPKSAREKLKHLQYQYILYTVERKMSLSIIWAHFRLPPSDTIKTKWRHNAKCLVSTEINAVFICLPWRATLTRGSCLPLRGFPEKHLRWSGFWSSQLPCCGGCGRGLNVSLEKSGKSRK